MTATASLRSCSSAETSLFSTTSSLIRRLRHWAEDANSISAMFSSDTGWWRRLAIRRASAGSNTSYNDPACEC